MKSLNAIPFRAEHKKGNYLSLDALFLSALQNTHTTIQAFAWLRKSKGLGKPGTTPFSEGHSTFGGTGALCPSGLPVIVKHGSKYRAGMSSSIIF